MNIFLPKDLLFPACGFFNINYIFIFPFNLRQVIWTHYTMDKDVSLIKRLRCFVSLYSIANGCCCIELIPESWLGNGKYCNAISIQLRLIIYLLLPCLLLRDDISLQYSLLLFINKILDHYMNITLSAVACFRALTTVILTKLHVDGRRYCCQIDPGGLCNQ